MNKSDIPLETAVEITTPNKGQMLEFLESHGTPWRTWGTRTWRSLDDLIRYMTDEQVVLRDGDVTKPPIIDVYCVVVIVLFGNLELFEEKQINRTTKGVVRRNLNGIAETLKKSEKADQLAVMRCLREELNFKDSTKYTLSDIIGIDLKGPIPSEKWNGLMAVHHRHIFGCRIAPELFCEDGYVEHDGEWDIHFKWGEKTSNILF